MTAPELIAVLKDLLLGLAGATTAVVAIVGLKNWSRELRGRATFEIARALVKATYKLRDELSVARSPLIRSAEFPEGYDALNPNKAPETQAQAYAHVYANRWAPVAAALQDFDSQSLEAEALWGGAMRQKTDQLRGCARDLYVAIEAVIENERSGGVTFTTDKALGKRMRQSVFATANDSGNALSTSIATAVREIEDEIRPHLRRS